MSYTTIQHIGTVHVQTIQPLDERIVRLALSSKTQGYGKSFNNTDFILYTHLALSGTRKRTKEELYSFLKKNGIELSITTQNGFVTFMLTTTPASLSRACDLIKEVVCAPRFPKSEFASTKSLMREENREAHDDARTIAHIEFTNALYDPHSNEYQLTLAEQGAHIEHIQFSDCKKLVRAVREGEWSISFVGNTENEKKLIPLLGKLSKNAHLVTRTDTISSRKKKTRIFKTVHGKTNVELRIGNVLPITPRDDEYDAFVFGLSVLGKVGGFSGRLMSTIREREGLTYGIYANTVHFNSTSTGHWNIFTFFTANDLKRGIDSIKREIRTIVTTGITKRELEVFKDIIENQYLIAHDSNARRLALYHGALLCEESENILSARIRRIKALTCTEVNAALVKFLDPDALVIAGAGPVHKNGTGIK